MDCCKDISMNMNVWVVLILPVVANVAFADDAKKPLDFGHDVVPVLKKHCVACHGGKESKGGFSLNTRELVLDAEAVVVGQAAKSRLIELVTSADPKDQMPPKGKARLDAKELAALSRWINDGLKWDTGFSFSDDRYEPPLKPRRVELPVAVSGRTHPIDRIVDRYLADAEVEFPEPISDRVFVRRSYLDLIGLLPTEQQLEEFSRDTKLGKRSRLVAILLGNNISYAEHWLTFWNDLLRNDYTGTGFITGGRKQITGWLYRSLVENKPYDQMVQQIIVPGPTSVGFIQGIKWRGNVNSSQTLEVQFAQNISQAFLGINMKCASCHDSFIDHWKVAEAYGLAAIYATRELEIHRCDKPTGKMAKAAWLFPELGKIDAKADQQTRLKQLADLMTHRDNGRFTRTIVNRIWHRLMGRGIVHPVDAMGTRPWDEDLLEYLAEHLVENKYNLKATIELICTSQIYQAQIAANKDSLEGQEYVFRGPLARRLTAEQFVDAVWQITQTAPTKFDAKVTRIDNSVAKKDAKSSGSRLSKTTARWVWSSADATSDRPKAGEQITVRKEFELKQVPERAFAVITCDNEYTVFVNGQQVAADSNWETVETVVFTQHLKAGKNTILIVAKNGGNSPNPAGLFFEGRLMAGKSVATLGTDSTWNWTAAIPQRGRFKKPQKSWKPVAEITTPIWQSRVVDQIQQGLQRGESSPLLMVRASLVKNNPLMKSLGRPDRNQIVTMRPSQFTTLEAIDLANGQILSNSMIAGSQQIVNSKRFNNNGDFIEWLFRSTLSRSPNEQEMTLAVHLLGEELNKAGVEDLLWAVMMLPEFHLVR